MEITLEVQCGLGAELVKLQQKKGKGRTYEMTSVLTVTSDNTFVDYRRIPCVYLQGMTPRLRSDAPHRTRSLEDGKTFTVFAELTKPSQSVVTVISSVRADLVGFDLVIDLLQETIAGDAVSHSFRPDLPGSEYPTPNTKPPAPGQDSEEYREPVNRGASPTILDCDDHEPRFSSPSPAPIKIQGKKPLVGSERSNSRERKVGTSYEEWRPERLSNGNYRRVSSLDLGSGPLPCLRCNHTCKDRNNCRHIWYFSIRHSFRLTQCAVAVERG